MVNFAYKTKRREYVQFSLSLSLSLSLFHFLHNQYPMKIVFTSSYKTYSKENTKNYTSNSYVLIFLISVIFFCLQFRTEGVFDKI